MVIRPHFFLGSEIRILPWHFLLYVRWSTLLCIFIHFLQGGTAELAVLVYSPADGRDGTWMNEAPREAMEKALKFGEPR